MWKEGKGEKGEVRGKGREGEVRGSKGRERGGKGR